MNANKNNQILSLINFIKSTYNTEEFIPYYYFFGDNYYQQCVIKILGGDKGKSVIHNKIKSKLYNYLKFNLKRIIQFEFN